MIEVNKSAITIKKCVEEFVDSESLKRKKQKEKVFTKGVLYDFSDEITAGWYIADLFDITNLITCGVAKRPDYVDEGIPFLSAQNARPFKTNLNKIRYIDEITFNKITVGGKPEKGDVLYTRVGNCGEAATIPYDFDFGIYVSLTLIKPNKLFLDSDYLTAFLNSRFGVMQATQGAIGIGLKNLNVDNVRRFIIPLPSLTEQKRIVEKLDSLLAQVDTIQQRLNTLPNIIKRFRQSVLAAAVSGKLTEQWRGEHGSNLGRWENLKLNEVTSHVVDCPHSTPKWSEEGQYCVRTTAFNPFFLDMKDQGFVTQETFDKRNARLVPVAGDILYSREGTVGIACQIPDGIELCLGQRMVVIRANEKISSTYLTMVLNSHHILSIVQELTIGSTAPRVNMKVIRDYPIPTPSKKEQTEIVRLVEQHFALADTLEKHLKNAKQRVDNLTQSILAKAFKGELVPQDPNDEPAEQLLARIKAARAEAEQLEKAAKKASKKTKG